MGSGLGIEKRNFSGLDYPGFSSWNGVEASESAGGGEVSFF